MASFQHLPAEIRLVILEYLLWSFAWLGPPDADALDADEWYHPPQPPSRGIIPVISFAHQTSPETLIRPLLRVSKQFQADTKYVWKQLVEPKLRHVISFTGVGNGTHANRPVVGLLVKWLCKPILPAANGVIEARIRFCDHEMGADGDHRGLHRSVQNLTPGLEDWTSLNQGLEHAYRRIRVGELPEHDALSQTVIASITTLKIVFDSTLSAGLHWTHSEMIHYKEPQTKVLISLHPYHDAMDEGLSNPWDSLLHEDNRFPLSRCDILIDEALVRRFRRSGSVVTEETYPYDLPVDPLCRP